MNKKILILLALFGLFFNVSSSYGFGFVDKNQKEVKLFLKNHSRAMKSQNLEEIKTFYDENYKSSDGFNLKELLEMLDKTNKTYAGIKYKTKIGKIDAKENTASANMSDLTYATVYPNNNKKYKDKTGELKGKSNYIVNLKKENGSWKIVSDSVLEEETSLKYGIAKKINMDLITPASIKKGEEYDLSLTMNKPLNIVALASLTREEISYPPKDYQEKYRRIPDSNTLERLVRANEKNLDEYAIASVGFTKVSINEQINKARIEVLGIAYVMKRINMDKTPQKREEI